jgi:hypothetical protein
MKNWRTTAAGVLALAGVVVEVARQVINGEPVSITPAMASAVAAAIGLFFAADAAIKK